MGPRTDSNLIGLYAEGTVGYLTWVIESVGRKGFCSWVLGTTPHWELALQATLWTPFGLITTIKAETESPFDPLFIPHGSFVWHKLDELLQQIVEVAQTLGEESTFPGDAFTYQHIESEWQTEESKWEWILSESFCNDHFTLEGYRKGSRIRHWTTSCGTAEEALHSAQDIMVPL